MASASYDYKPDGSMSYNEKPGFTASSDSSEPAEYGQVSNAKKRWGFSLAVDQEPSSFAATPSASNADFDPTPPSRRTWSWLAYVSYWMADAWAVSNWEVASSMIAVGLSWKEAIGACVLGNTIMAIVITVNGRIGATLHTPFPVLARMPFGYYFSYFVVVSRCVLATVWLGVQTTTGGQCMVVLFSAIWPSYKNIPNHFSADEGITTGGMIGFFIYFLLQLPFLCIPYHRIQIFFSVKAVIAPMIFLAVFGSTLAKAGGTVANSTVITGIGQPHIYGSTLAWAFFANLNGQLGNYATLGLNIADFARYSKTPNSQNVQVVVIPCIFTIVGLLGIFTAAASQTAYPDQDIIWNPIVVVGNWAESGSHGGRAAAAFGAIGLLIVTLGINISANSISAANDLVSFCPKYINIRRGQLLAAVIGSWAFVPWKILASAQKFISFLGGYTIFLGPMTAILITDYYIIRRGRVSVPDFYNFNGIYRYGKYGTNWRAVAALFIGFAPPLPGFIQNIQSTIPVSMGGQHLFAIGYIYSFISAGIFYYGFMTFFPARESMIDAAITGEDIIVAADQKRRLEAARA